MKRSISIAGRAIGPGKPCYIIAEISGNHHQNYDEAEALVRTAHEAGADAVKLQTFTPDTITMNSRKEPFMVAGPDNPDVWKGKSLYELYQTAYTPWDWQPKLKAVADSIGITLFSAPFDETAVDFLMGMNVPAFKVASYETGHIPLLAKIAQTGKPVIMSVGMTTLPEIELAVATLRQHGASEIAILHCITSYADMARPEDAHLATIRDLADRFDVVSGFSDNNAGIATPLQAVLAGAVVIEKHLILDRELGGPDARFSLDPAELQEFVQRVRSIEAGEDVSTVLNPLAVGEPAYGPLNDAERYNQRFRRSIFVTKDVHQGESFTRENVRVIRPNHGLHSQHYEEVLTKHASGDIEAGTPLAWELVKGGRHPILPNE